MDAQASQANPSAEVYQRKLEKALGRVTTAEEKVQRLETELGDNESSRSQMEAELEENEQEIGQLQGELATQREQLHKEIELDRFRCVEEERRKWEARESRLVDQLERLSKGATLLPPLPLLMLKGNSCYLNWKQQGKNFRSGRYQ